MSAWWLVRGAVLVSLRVLLGLRFEVTLTAKREVWCHTRRTWLAGRVISESSQELAFARVRSVVRDTGESSVMVLLGLGCWAAASALATWWGLDAAANGIPTLALAALGALCLGVATNGLLRWWVQNARSRFGVRLVLMDGRELGVAGLSAADAETLMALAARCVPSRE